MTPVIPPTSRYALKEWAVVVKALAQGRQTILLRKGGILEDRDGFTTEHREFFLYPTYLHEHADRILPSQIHRLEEALRFQPPEDRVFLSVFATVEETVFLTELDRLEKLRPYHILSDDEVRARFEYRGKPGLHVILLRVYRLEQAIELPVTPDFAGCKSWVDLGGDLSTSESRPALDDAAYRRQMESVLSFIR